MPAWLPLVILLMVVFVFGLFTLPMFFRSRPSRSQSYQSQSSDLLLPTGAGASPVVSSSTWSGRAMIGAETEKQQGAGDLVSQINELVQGIMAADSSMRNSTIYVGKDAYHGVRITINDQTYTSIEEIPEGTEKNILRAATSAWSARSMSPEYTVQPKPPVTPAPAPMPEPAAASSTTPAPAQAPSLEQPAPILMPSLSANPTIVLAETTTSETHPQTCLVCGHELPAGSRFCPYCGSSPLQSAATTCPQCHEPVESGWQFCNHCGYRLSPS